ncbi:MAG TPA: DUF411 domain-containing protein [Gemmatimonadaceae bacterium]|nr:DUF411 domain-containing protein [Gemmatimonadaceae bacterium]
MSSKIGVCVAIVFLASTAACKPGAAETAGESKVAASSTPNSTAPLSAAAAEAAQTPSPAGAQATLVKVYKDPNCGCCKKWVEHLEKNGFKVESFDMPDMSLIKQKHAVTGELQSCHTALVGDYVVEGHVPADVIRRLLKEKPAVAGLAVPGMPMGSPGMEGATKEKYDILTFDRAGRTKVYAQR